MVNIKIFVVSDFAVSMCKKMKVIKQYLARLKKFDRMLHAFSISKHTALMQFIYIIFHWLLINIASFNVAFPYQEFVYGQGRWQVFDFGEAKNFDIFRGREVLKQVFDLILKISARLFTIFLGIISKYYMKQPISLIFVISCR